MLGIHPLHLPTYDKGMIMKDNNITDEKDISNFFGAIRFLIEQSRNRVYRTMNVEMLFLYWNIDRMVVEEQGGAPRAKYEEERNFRCNR